MNLTKHIYALVTLVLFLLTGIRAGYAFDATCNLIQTINTSQFSPPSPDPAGIAYLRAPGAGNLMISDSEVEETMQGITLYQGVNMFEVTPGGSQVDTWDTTNLSKPSPPLPNPPPCNYSNEPTGVAYNPNTDHLFISDDNKDDVYEISRGADGFFGTAPNGSCDDGVTTFDTAGFGATDPEGVGYGDGAVWIANGANKEVYKIALGANQVLGGGDDQITHFDTQVLGITDPEGIDYDPVSRHLFLVSRNKKDTLYEVTPAGALVRTIGVLPVPTAKNLAGVGVGPTNQGNLEVYIAARGVDNDTNPSENDGKVYKCVVPSLATGNNQAPIVSVGLDQSINLPTNSATLDGTVTDDVLPNPPGQATTAWSQVSGPGMVTFADPTQVGTTSFGLSVIGTYVLRLTANDSALSASDEDIEAAGFTPNGALVVSTTGSPGVACPACPSLNEEGLLVYTGAALGEQTTNSWNIYFDGSDVALSQSSSEDVNGTEIDGINGDIYLTTAGVFSLPGVSGDGTDIFVCAPGSTGATTSCAYRPFFDGSANGLSGDVDAFDVA